MDYGYFDEMDRFHWLLPLIGGDTIGLDNTCKTMLELQTFFNGDSHAKPPRLSALTVLMNYQEHLKNDIDKLIMSVPSGHLLLVTKKKG